MCLREHAPAVVEVDREGHRHVAAVDARRTHDRAAEAAFDHALQGGVHGLGRFRSFNGASR